MNSNTISLIDVGKMMREIFRVLKQRMEDQGSVEMKITIEEFSLLHAITTTEEDVIQKDMAEMMGKDKSAILRLIDSLEEKGLVRRVSDTKDRRKNFLMVTKVGQRVLAHYIGIVYQLLVDIQPGLTQSDLDTYSRVVNTIIQNTEKL